MSKKKTRKDFKNYDDYREYRDELNKKERERLEDPVKRAESNRKRRERLEDPVKRAESNRKEVVRRGKDREKINAGETRRRRNDRLAALTKYSKGDPHCLHCGETIMVFLTIDHINGREPWKHSKNISGKVLYAWLRRQNYPSGFQVLCYTWNHIKSVKEREIKHSKTTSAMRHRIFNQNLKTIILTHYSKIKKPQCVCCEYDEIEGLTLDHQQGRINTKHKKGLGGDKLYRWVRDEYQNTGKYPLGLETLCFNCNSGRDKSPGKICPHKL